MEDVKTVKVRSRQRRTRGKPNAVDIHVGKRIRQRRTLLGMSQERLAEALDLTFQQVQKYERGTNRIGAGRLWELAVALDVPMTYFFDELPTRPGAPTEPMPAAAGPDPMHRRETLVLVRAYYGIKNQGVRSHLIEMFDKVAEAERAEPEMA